MEDTHANQLLALAGAHGMLRTRDLKERGIARMTLKRLVNQGKLLRVARGVYMHPEAEITEHHSLAEASTRFPAGVVCLLSALAFHDLSDEAPFEVWMACERGKTRPQITQLPIRLVTFAPKHFHFGVQTHVIEGVNVPITTPAKTVVDCFKFRGQVGLEPCLAALKDYRRQKAGSLEALIQAARVCRMTNVIKPYMEALW